MKVKLILFIFLSVTYVNAQSTSKRVLFIGNSYTYFNDLPNMLRSMANTVGDTLTHDSHTPGGNTLQNHFNNSIPMNKIRQGNWDFVVLQEQSQLPAFPIGQVQSQVFPYAKSLNDTIIAYNPCAETVFYMTWGRKNGDASNCSFFPNLCTYEGMDDLLRERYETMANDNDAIISPVGPLWRYLRQNHAGIELYNADESHPSAEGTYAAACAFYSVLFRKDPTLITFNSTISAANASTIRQAAKLIVFDSLSNWNVGSYDPVANFQENTTGNMVQLTNNSQNASTYLWNFGDGNTSTSQHPTHTYTIDGNYTITLTAKHCGYSSIVSKNVQIYTTGIEDSETDEMRIFPNPATNSFQINVGSKQMESNYSIYNIQGQKMKVGIIQSSQENIDISNLNTGIYIIKHEQTGKVFKFIKK